MAIKINCENGHRLNAPENLLGKRVKCPKCGVSVLITTDAAPPLSPANQSNQSPKQTPTAPASPEPFPDFGVSGFDDFGPPPENAFSNIDFASLPITPVSPAPASLANPQAARSAPGSLPVSQSRPGTQSTEAAPSPSGIHVGLLVASILGGGVMGLGTLLVAWLLMGGTSGNVKATEIQPQPERVGSTAKAPAPVSESRKAETEETKAAERVSEPTRVAAEKKESPKDDRYESFLSVRSKTDISELDEFTKRQKDELLAKQFVKFLDAQVEAGKVERAKVNEDEIRYAKVPFFLMITDSEFSNIRGNIKDPNVKTRIELLEFGMKEFGIEGWADVGQEDTAASERIYADMLAYRWRHYLMIKQPELDKATYRLIRHIEDKCFGINSLFYGFNLTDDNKVLGEIASIFETLGNRLDEVDSTGVNPNGFPLIQTGNLSWRVALLPYLKSYTEDNIDTKTLYKEFRLDEPWDSEANLKLVKKMPSLFKTKKVKEPGYTAIHMITHERGLFRPGVNEKVDFQDQSTGGPTPLVILAGAETAEPWTKPGGLPFDETKDASQFGTPPIRNYFPYVSGGVPLPRYFVAHTPKEQLRDLFFVDDGQRTAAEPYAAGRQLKSYFSDLAPLQNKLWQQASVFEKGK